MEINCAFCHKVFKTQLWKTKKYKNLFCSFECATEFKKKQVELTCHCGNKFSVAIFRLSKSKTISCSTKCGYKAIKLNAQITRQCKFCGKDFSFPKSRAKYSKKEFCSLICSNKSQPRGKQDSNYKHGIGRYREIAYSNFSKKCTFCNKIKKYMDVHHKDHNRLNNDISNLIILCRSCHLKHHKSHPTHPP